MTNTTPQKTPVSPHAPGRTAAGKSPARLEASSPALQRLVWPAAILAAICLVAFGLRLSAPEAKSPRLLRAPNRLQVHFLNPQKNENLYRLTEKYAVWSPAAIALPERVFQRKTARKEITGEILPPLELPNKTPLFVERAPGGSPPPIPLPEPGNSADSCGLIPFPHLAFQHSPSGFPPLPGAALHEPALTLSAGLQSVESDFTPLLTEPWPATDIPVTLSAQVKFHPGDTPPAVLLEQTADDPMLNRRFALLLRQCAAFQAPAEGAVSLRLPLNGVTPH